MINKAMLLVGSPRRARSASEIIGNLFLEALARRGVKTSKTYIDAFYHSQQDEDQLLEGINSADVIILSAPLYFDGPPAPVMAFMETMKECHVNHEGKKLIAVSNCGFLESFQNDTVLKVYREFAMEVGFEWMGGLGIGMGIAVSCFPIKKSLMVFRHIRGAVEITTDALCEEKAMPAAVYSLVKKHTMPSYMYNILASFYWRLMLAKNGNFRKSKIPNTKNNEKV